MRQEIFNKQWRYINHTTIGKHFSALHSFAYDDTFSMAVGALRSLPVLRSWVHSKTVALGIQESRLPYKKDGIDFLQRQQYEVIVRNSGGLSVVLDEGILNLSLIFKEDKTVSINAGYELMYALIKHALARYSANVIAKEIVGSYCPGSYDLSISNKKFAGISQRRIRGGIAVQIYICIEGSGSERAFLIKRFYEEAIKGKETTITYPKIEPYTMASLSELLQKPLTVSQVMLHILQTITEKNGKVTLSQLDNWEEQILQENIEKVEQRNRKALAE